MKSRKLQYTKLLILLGVVFLAAPLFAQVETLEDCFSRKSNSDLKNLNKKQKKESVDGRFYSTGANIPVGGLTWQTSFKPLNAPPNSKPSNMSQNDWAKKTCAFNAFQVHDNREGTFWCEGVSGPGIGEAVSGYISLENKNYFYILPGANGLRKNFESFSRPLEIVVHYLIPGEIGISQSGGKIFTNVEYFGKQPVKLSSEPGYQKIEIQPYKEIIKEIKGKQYPLILVAIEIKSVIEGKENKEHTCIAEIGNSEDDAFYKKPTLRD
ncbi:NADase-type glycan-binding domain-containing protein [Leptospira noguchii]|uniref:NADase-type glycan-binding domain-containing protein n=1 Tax=Leptospira noguchii TaxID=28182 RepID=UPI001FB75A1C|nr:hypothetical protein [Leptospira noguchii]UOG41298.1 hypothetical protein MAL05_16100 [Leptospira noguchii]